MKAVVRWFAFITNVLQLPVFADLESRETKSQLPLFPVIIMTELL